MNLNDNGQMAYENRIRDAWKRKCDTPEDQNCYLPDGMKIRVPLKVMDHCQASRPTSASDANRHLLDSHRAQADAVKRHADYFTGLREGREKLARDADAGGQLEYEARISGAWRRSPGRTY